ncbi:hypothetical protein HDV06_004168, partial [Boothiomyces sp. JEL0866]
MNKFEGLDFTPVILQEPSIGRDAGLKSPYLSTLLNPPLIIKLQFSTEISIAQLNSFTFICQVSLYAEDQQEVLATLKKSPFCRQKFTNNLEGDTICNGVVIKDFETGDPAIYFIFKNLNVKTVGEYTLQCNIIELN